jgi:hypothetical protein
MAGRRAGGNAAGAANAAALSVAKLRRPAERAARDCGKTLLVLDTASPDAERLYARQGWQRVGVIPGYALMPDGALCGTTYFYRELPLRA